MKWLKAGAVGALAALVMLVIIQILIAAGIAPFQQAPSAAFLDRMGIPPLPLALLVHFGYGIVWSILFVAAFQNADKLLGKGLGLGVVLWLIMMLVASPMIGWGIFGIADTSNLPEALQLGSPAKYIIATLVLHLIYGGIVGWANPAWLKLDHRAAAPKTSA